MFGLIKKIFIGMLTSLVHLIHLKCVSLLNQKYKIQPTIINLHPNGYTQALHSYSFAVNLDRCLEVVVSLMTCLI